MPTPSFARFSGHECEFRNPAVDCPLGLSVEIPVTCARSRRRFANGFTLIELLVAISIIALLLSIGAVGAMTAMRHSQRSKVKAMFESLQASQGAYQSGTTSRINHTGSAPIDWSDTFAQNAPGASGSAVGTGLSSSERFVVGCLQHPDSDSAVRAATNERGALSDQNANGFLEIIDPWEKPILYLTYNDQTGTTDGVSNNLFPISRDPFFVSSGPDGTFGTDDDITSNEIGS